MALVGVYHRPMTMTTVQPETTWCSTCRARREVMDTYLTDDGDQYRENAGQGSGARTYVAQPLECGHNAADSGATPSRRRPTQDPTLVARLVALQEARR